MIRVILSSSFIRRFGIALLAFALAGCSINRKTTAAHPATQVRTIYIEQNPRVLMEGLHGEIEKQVRDLGFATQSYLGARPAEARHVLSYTANWQWDMAMYLTYFQATLSEDGRVIGQTEYDARFGGGRLDKFGPTADKIRPQLKELLSGASPAAGVPQPGAPAH